MKKIQLSAVVLIATLIMSGCNNPKPKIEKEVKKTQISKPVVQKPSGMTLSQLNSGGVTKLVLKGPHKYRVGEPVRFIVDTKGQDGYLYILYLDNKGQVGKLYPNAKAPLSEIGGQYIFPRDFGGMSIIATKDCKTCAVENTSIYALLTKEPILDIDSIDKAKLLSIAPPPSNVKTKGLSMDLGGDSSASNSNVNVGVIQFTTE